LKKSITIQFSFIFISILAGTILMCLTANVFFLKDFYMATLRSSFIDAYNDVNNSFADTKYVSELTLYEIAEISRRYDVEILIVDSAATVVLSAGMESEDEREQLLNVILSQNDTLLSNTKSKYYFLHTQDVRANQSYMEMLGVLDNDYRFYFRAPLENIENHVAVANRFLIQVSGVAIIIGVLVIVYMTRRVTTPIKQLAHISNRMANLDFSAHYESSGDNEVDMLGRHMNVMSNKLENTISKLKTANVELQKDIERKNKNEELRKEFLTNISHELKTPIALIQGYAEGLKDGIQDDPESRNFYCDVIIDEANRMNNMVRNLMNLSEIEAGKNTAKLERVNLTDLVENILRSLELTFEQKEIKLIVQYEKDTYVWADAFQIEEVVRNYITNAINHIGGDRILSITFTKLEKRIRVNVFNSGQPIPEESIPLIWDKFYKVDKARTREYGGSGVGLSIVKAIMESMDCKYGVHNHDNGVSFYFEVESIKE